MSDFTECSQKFLKNINKHNEAIKKAKTMYGPIVSNIHNSNKRKFKEIVEIFDNHQHLQAKEIIALTEQNNNLKKKINILNNEANNLASYITNSIYLPSIPETETLDIFSSNFFDKADIYELPNFDAKIILTGESSELFENLISNYLV